MSQALTPRPQPEKNSEEFHVTVPVPLNPAHTHRGITGSVLPLKDGSLLFAYADVGDTLRTPSGEFDGGIAGRKSTDGGRTWGKPFTMVPNLGLAETVSPSLLRLDNGEILFFYDVQMDSEEDPSKMGDMHTYVCRSKDEGKTWTMHTCVGLFPGIVHSMPDKVVKLSGGRIIVPLESNWPVRGERYVSLCFYSDNNGYSWCPSDIIDLGPDCATEEPSVAELEDGRLIMVFRSLEGYLSSSYSGDKGETWSKPKLLKDLPAPGHGFAMVRIPNTADLLAIYCHNLHSPGLAAGEEQLVVNVAQLKRPLGAIRAPLTTAISQNDGKTWKHHRNIVESPKGDYDDFGYPGVTWLEDGKVSLVNFHARNGIRMARIRVDWFYGK